MASVTIKDKNGRTVLHTVAKTARGFNRKQREAIALARIEAAESPSAIIRVLNGEIKRILRSVSAKVR